VLTFQERIATLLTATMVLKTALEKELPGGKPPLLEIG
jgi:hypothetical protein